MNRRTYSPHKASNKSEIDKCSLKVEKDWEMESGTEWHTAGSVGRNFVIRGERNQRVFGIQSDHSDGWTRTVSVCEWMYSTGTPSQSSVSQHFKPSTPTLSHFTSQLVLILFKLRQQFFLRSSPPLYLNMSRPQGVTLLNKCKGQKLVLYKLIPN